MVLATTAVNAISPRCPTFMLASSWGGITSYPSPGGVTCPIRTVGRRAMHSIGRMTYTASLGA